MMEDLKTKLNKLTDTSKYRLKINNIKEILVEFKTEMSKKEKFNKAREIDKKYYPSNVSLEKIISIIDEFINLKEYNLKYTPNMIIDGYGNIGVYYNGDPYITLRFLLMALRTHNNIVFFCEKNYGVNSIIIETLNMILAKKINIEKIAMVEFNTIDGEIISTQTFFNKMVFVGDKMNYVKMRNKLAIPIIYAGFGNIDVYVDGNEFKNLILDINQYSKENNIEINYHYDVQIEEIIEDNNKYELTDSCVFLSKDTDLIYRFISEIKAKNIYINKNPFEEYKLSITESDLLYKKKITMV